jgi:AcrR family transcriptional regulator
VTTKDKIIAYATEQFNAQGYSAVSLYQIAQGMGMSRGNLTYHFKEKDDLLLAISEEMWNKLEKAKSESIQLPSFENLHNTVNRFYHFQKEYAFIFLDRHVFNHELILQKFRAMAEKTIEENITNIAFSIRIGNLKPEPVKGLYHNICFITWMMTFFWHAQEIIRGKVSEEAGEKMIWSILLPHFTEKGVKSFISFFGKEYYESLGTPFEQSLESLISF